MGYIESDSSNTFDYKDNRNLENIGFYTLKNLDELSLLNTSDFSATRLYVSKSLPQTVSFDLEYYNATGCYSVDNSGVLGTVQTYCDSISAITKNDISSVFYTKTGNDTSESVRLYMWRLL